MIDLLKFFVRKDVMNYRNSFIYFPLKISLIYILGLMIRHYLKMTRRRWEANRY